MQLMCLGSTTEQTRGQQLKEAKCKGKVMGGLRSDSGKIWGDTALHNKEMGKEGQSQLWMEQTEIGLGVYDHTWVKSNRRWLGGEVWESEWKAPPSTTVHSAWKKVSLSGLAQPSPEPGPLDLLPPPSTRHTLSNEHGSVSNLHTLDLGEIMLNRPQQ